MTRSMNISPIARSVRYYYRQDFDLSSSLLRRRIRVGYFSNLGIGVTLMALSARAFYGTAALGPLSPSFTATTTLGSLF